MLIYRYLAKQIYSVMCAVTGLLIFIIVCNQFVHFLRHAQGDHLLMGTVLKLVLFQIPAVSGYLLPLGFFLGVLLTYGRMYADSELTVLQCCGFSRLRLIGTTLTCAMGVFVLCAALAFWLQPKLFWAQGRLIYQAKASSALQLLSPGVFQPMGQRWTLYAQDRTDASGAPLHNIFAAKAPRTSKDKWLIVLASRATQSSGPEHGGVLRLESGRHYYGQAGTSEYEFSDFDQFRLRMLNKPFSDAMLMRHKGYLSTPTLWRARKTDPRAVAELQLRASVPLSVLILGLLAVPLSRVNIRRIKHAQLLPAILIYTVYMNLLFVSRAWLKTGHFSAQLGMWWVHALFFLLACGLIARDLGGLSNFLRGRLK